MQSAKQVPSRLGPTPDNSSASWRESKVPEDAVISKSMAFKQYRLKPEDLDGIPFDIKPGQLGGYPCDRYLYNERDVERKAWERHGGPEGFDAYLSVLRNRYNTRTRKPGKWTPFRQPKSYDNDGDAVDS
ncbi:hypothetical protein GSI_02814 [Ganoderma sinense ZZ0214-1]|uniref:Uncharacterized protein n=1 Tax=Ganoderma sinense ZZ0214-1 TaxID=1077348 RepID=A0A2G8SMM8_9APHY|nr:hypothetical protein GSI_02814 [Ganoderma sinense ZZ0214-1]